MNLNLSSVAVAILATVLSPPSAPVTPPQRITKHSGMCDASAAVPVGPILFAIAITA